MRKGFALTLGLFLSFYAFADFVEKHFDGQKVTVDQATSCFNEWFETGDCEFHLLSDETDEIGMRHIAYQQYCSNVKVEKSILIVHSVNNQVLYINGDVLKQKTHVIRKPEKLQSKIKHDSTSHNTLDRAIIHLQLQEGDKYIQVYKVETDFETKYIDTETGEIIKSVPKFQYAVSTTGQTKYSGEQTFKCDYKDSKYYLTDSERNIKVFCTEMDFNTGSYGTRYNYTSSSNTWEGNYLTSITINSVRNDWWGILADSYPDLYITITDENDQLLYVSDYKSDVGQEWIFPVTFRISTMIRIPLSGGYKIKVWDYDPIGDNDLGFTGSLNNNNIGIHQWTNSSANVQMSCEISKWHPALDVMWGLSSVYDYYKNVFNRNSFDNKGALIQGLLHRVSSTANIKDEYGKAVLGLVYVNQGNYNNAYAMGNANDATTAYLHFGLGNEIEDTRVGLNTMSHEFTHLICTYRTLGDLEYSGESGALNESMADMMALSIEHYVTPATFNWQYGEDHMLNGGCTRDFQNPEKGVFPQPNTYGVGPYWKNPSNTQDDNGGVHSNSGVSNHWFYLLCEGGKGTNSLNNSYSITGIGIEKAQRIIFRALLNYFPSQTTFAEARNLTIQSAKDLYPNDKSLLQAITDAWYAVGVGDKYVAEPEESQKISCAQAVQITSALSHNTPTNETYTVIGYVTDTDGKVSNNQQIFWMADTKSGGKVFESYWGNVPEVVRVGDKVSVTGPLMRYNSTSEIKNGNVVIIEKATQSVDQITNDQSPMTNKIIKDNQLLILRGDKVYTVTGQEVK